MEDFAFGKEDRANRTRKFLNLSLINEMFYDRIDCGILIPFFFSGRIAEASLIKSVKEGQIGKANLLGSLSNGEFSASDQGFCLMKAYGVAIVHGGRSQIFLK